MQTSEKRLNTEISNHYQISNNMPDKQAIVLQNTNEKLPLQVKISQDTDYIALFFTLIVAIITSIISAVVTVKLVSKSNKNLVDNQEKIHGKQLEFQSSQQKNEIRSRNRQEWINNVRLLISQYLTYSSNLMTNLLTAENARIICKTDTSYLQEYKTYSDTLRINYNNLVDISMLIDLTLSKDNPIDRHIVELINEINKSYIAIAQSIGKDINENIITSQINYNFLKKFQEHDIIIQNRASLLELTKVLLKNEWERVKNLE